MTATWKYSRIAFLALVLGGLGLALELTRLYVMVRVDPDFQSACALNEALNCLTVAESGYSAFLGAPVSVWGLGAYLGMGVVAAATFAPRRLTRLAAAALLLALSAFSVAISAVLFYIAEVLIQVLCPYCMATYIVNLALLVCSVLILKSEHPREARAVLSEDPRGAAAALSGLIFIPALALAMLALPAVSYLLAFGDLNDTRPELDTGMASGLTGDGHPWIGARDPEVVIEEFTDYQCPHCRRSHDFLRESLPAYAGRLRIVHRHFPLDHQCNPMIPVPYHQCACLFSYYAVCAQEQGKFWEMNDWLFALPRTNECPDEATAARAAGLDFNAFRQCLESESPKLRVMQDLEAGRAIGLHATPTYLYDGHTVAGRLSKERLEAIMKGEVVEKEND